MRGLRPEGYGYALLVIERRVCETREPGDAVAPVKPVEACMEHARGFR